MKLDIGCGPFKAPGFVGMDIQDSPAVDIIHDLSVYPWPVDSNSCEYIRAFHVLEHLADNVSALNECYRILQEDGILEIEVPTTDGMGAFSDPTHKSFWNADRLKYLCPGIDENVYRNTPFSCKFEIIDMRHYNMRENVVVMNARIKKI